MKLNVSVETLCSGLPLEFQEYMSYCKNLKFDEKPDYLFLARLFKDLSIKLEYHNDHLFDWTMLRYTKAMVEKQRDLLIEKGDSDVNNNANSASSADNKSETFNKIKLLAMKKFPTHFHYYKNEDKHNPSPEEIKQQTILNNNAASSLPEELLNALDKGMENLRQQQPQQQGQSSPTTAAAATAAARWPKTKLLS